MPGVVSRFQSVLWTERKPPTPIGDKAKELAQAAALLATS
jgi:hypothetical protein